MSLMRNTVLQNRMALDIIAASQGGPYATVQTEYCVFLPDESANGSPLLNHRKTQINVPSNLTSSLGDLKKKAVIWIMKLLEKKKKKSLILGIVVLICVFSYMCLLCCYICL